MLDFMNQFSESEGDFFWSLACHSYPAQLGNPCTWDDEQATYSMDTEYVTLKNLEVLDKWVKTSRNQYKGTIRRSVWLSEAGTCSPSYEDDDFRIRLPDLLMVGRRLTIWTVLMAYNGIVGLTIWEMVLVWDCVSMPMHLIMVKPSLYGQPIKKRIQMKKRLF